MEITIRRGERETQCRLVSGGRQRVPDCGTNQRGDIKDAKLVILPKDSKKLGSRSPSRTSAQLAI